MVSNDGPICRECEKEIRSEFNFCPWCGCISPTNSLWLNDPMSLIKHYKPTLVKWLDDAKSTKQLPYSNLLIMLRDRGQSVVFNDPRASIMVQQLAKLNIIEIRRGPDLGFREPAVYYYLAKDLTIEQALSKLEEVTKVT